MKNLNDLPTYKISNWYNNKMSEMELSDTGEYLLKTEVEVYLANQSFPTLEVVYDEPSAGSEPSIETKIFATEADKQQFINEWIAYQHILKYTPCDLGNSGFLSVIIAKFEGDKALHYLSDVSDLKPFSYQNKCNIH